MRSEVDKNSNIIVPVALSYNCQHVSWGPQGRRTKESKQVSPMLLLALIGPRIALEMTCMSVFFFLGPNNAISPFSNVPIHHGGVHKHRTDATATATATLSSATWPKLIFKFWYLLICPLFFQASESSLRTLAEFLGDVPEIRRYQSAALGARFTGTFSLTNHHSWLERRFVSRTH